MRPFEHPPATTRTFAIAHLTRCIVPDPTFNSKTREHF
jgi:hypothetical protein